LPASHFKAERRKLFFASGGGQALPQFEEAVYRTDSGGAHENSSSLSGELLQIRSFAGKTRRLFSVVVREIQAEGTFPELDDDFAKDHGECGSLVIQNAIPKRLRNEPHVAMIFGEIIVKFRKYLLP